jgi:hypothetical protein
MENKADQSIRIVVTAFLDARQSSLRTNEHRKYDPIYNSNYHLEKPKVLEQMKSLQQFPNP